MTQASSFVQPTVIQHAQVLLPSGEIVPREVMLSGGSIAAIGTQLEVPEGTQVIDGSGCTLLPGVIDAHVHLREPGLEHKEDLLSATCACAKGGVTSFLEMPNTLPLTTTQAVLTDKLAIAAAKSLVNYGFFISVTAENLDDLRTAEPACGIEVFVDSEVSFEAGSKMNAEASSEASLEASSKAIGRSINTIEALAPIFATGDRLIAVHAENQARTFARRQQFAGETAPETHTKIQDSEVALSATRQVLSLSKQYQRRLHILQVSTAEEANLLRGDKPSWVSAEVTPHHLLLDISAYKKLGTLAQTNPPLRYPRDREILWQALKDGVIDFVASDHAPHTLDEKAKGYLNAPSGLPGVETALPLMLTQTMENRATVAEVANWMSTAVARAYNIPNKGLIGPGFDADLVLVDLSTYRPVLREELLTKCGWSPFEGWNLTGWPVVTIVGGQVVYDRGRINTQVRGKALQFGKMMVL